MAATAAGDRLTEQHRRLQLALRAATLTQLLAIWPAFDSADIDTTWPPVEAGLVALIQARGANSSGLAARYYEQFRTLEGAGPIVAHLPPPPPATDIIGGLRYAGPANARRLVAAGAPNPGPTTLTHVAGEVTRQTLNQGRRTITDNVESDPVALGYARVTDGNPCAFCAMLASRGPVYRSDQTGGFSAHGHCGCTAEPVFTRHQPWPGRNRHFQQLWARSTSGLHGDDARAAFRRAVEDRPLPTDPISTP